MTMRAPNRPHRRWLLLPLVLALVAAGLGAPAAASEHKRFTAHFTPDEVDGGAEITFKARLENHSPQQQLGSANITPPPGFTATAVGQPQVNGSPQGTADINQHGVVELRNLSAPPGATVTVEITAQTSCDPGTVYWKVLAKQANNFQGPPGNDLNLDETGSALTVTVTAGCPVAVRFVAERHPAHAAKDTTISSVAFDPAGAPVQVEVIDEDGVRVTSATDDITVAIANNPSGGTLDGTLTQAATDGVATFDDLEIDLSGLGYTLEATSGDLSPDTSDAFNVYDQACDPGETCQLDAGDLNPEADGMKTTASGTAGPGGGGLSVTVDATAVDCGDAFNHAPATTTLNGEGLANKVVEILIAKEVDQAQPNNGVAHYQVCATPLDEDSQFKDQNGELVVVGETGLLPDCGSPGAKKPPCVDSKTKTGAGEVLITVLWGSNLRLR